MVIFWCIIFIGIIVIAAIVSDAYNCGSTLIGLFGGVLLVILKSIAIEETTPSVKPIDVYRGRTTLEITYRDSVAIDSVVVWKED